ncbi:hypothetical protein E7V25_22280 [Escherichia coli]|nr:hypothetical protein [Escherichia coli]
MPENPASYRVVRTKSYLFNKAFICKKEYRLCLKSQSPVRKWSTGIRTLFAQPVSATFWLYERVHYCHQSTQLSGIK